MEDLIGIVVLVLIYAIAASSAGKKRRRKRTERAAGRGRANRGREARFDQAFSERNAPKEQAAPSGEGDRRGRRMKPAQPEVRPFGMAPQTASGEGEDPCHEGQMRPARPGVRLREATQLEMAASGEGEDPCHEGLRPARPGVRLRDAAEPEMAAVSEGEDPCHAFDRPAREEDSVYDSPILSSAPDVGEAARQVLAGVVMSEVLKRPAERRMERKLRRGA